MNLFLLKNGKIYEEFPRVGTKIFIVLSLISSQQEQLGKQKTDEIKPQKAI